MSSEYTERVERIERQMEFIADQQAKNSVDIAQLKDHARTLTDALMSLTRIVEQHDGQIAALNAQLAGLIQAGKETDRRFRETAERMKETDDRLNVLITVVERAIAGRQNGKGE